MQVNRNICNRMSVPSLTFNFNGLVLRLLNQGTCLAGQFSVVP